MRGIDRTLKHPSTTVGPDYVAPDWRNASADEVVTALEVVVADRRGDDLREAKRLANRRAS